MAKTKRQDFCVIGLGRFGTNVAHELAANGHNVILIDNDEEKVRLAAKEFEFTFVADTTDLNSLTEINIQDIKTVIVGISNIEESIMTCANLKELNIPRIIARAKNTVHRRVLRAIGVREAVIPEEIVGRNVALKAVHDISADIVNLGHEMTLFRAVVRNKDLFDKRMVDLNLRGEAGVNIISIQRRGELIFPVTANTILRQADSIAVVCKTESIEHLSELFSGEA